jgi:hypothetical protein
MFCENDISQIPLGFISRLGMAEWNQLSYDPKYNFNDRVLMATGEKSTINSDDFYKIFSEKTYDMLSYLSWDNVLMAGGSLTNIITGSKEKLNDIDLFVYGLDLESAKNKINLVVTQIKQRAENKQYETRIYQNNHVVNIYVFNTKKILEIQIILRLYNKLEEVLIGFDVDSCCVGYDGKHILTTPRGLFSFQNRVNVADITAILIKNGTHFLLSKFII